MAQWPILTDLRYAGNRIMAKKFGQRQPALAVLDRYILRMPQVLFFTENVSLISISTHITCN